jgi:hypothetical protein
MTGPDLSQATWRKSSRSQLQESECIEVAEVNDAVAVRDSKDADGPVLTLNAATWRSLLCNLKDA